jgi:hypothetical protein
MLAGLGIFVWHSRALGQEPPPGVGVSRQGIIQGDPIAADNSGSVIVNAAGFCSGTLLTNDWVITAAHCGLDIATPANVSVVMGAQTSVGVFAVTHPSLDFALLRLATPLRMNGSATGFRMPLYSDTTASLGGKILTCRGYGCNRYTNAPGGDGFDCVGNDGTLRQAMLLAKQGEYDDYNFDVAANDRGQLTGPGDSGTGCFASTANGLALAGILKAGGRPEDNAAEAHFGRPENWRDWAMAYVNGNPVPLPDQWHVGTSTPEQFLKRPLANGARGTHTWNPCPGGQQYLFSPVFDLEAGGDFVTLTSDGATEKLTGRGRMECFGRGPIMASLETNSSNQSGGLLSMPIACNRTPLGNGGSGCAEAFRIGGWTGAWGSDGPAFVGDLNGDGKTDVFMWRASDKSWTVNLSTGNGFTMQRWTGAWGSDGPIFVGDLNGDKKSDVFMWRASDTSWTINLSTGSGFTMQRWSGAWGSDGPISVGDLNGDGKTDVFMWRDLDKSWTVNLSTGSGYPMQRWTGAWGSDGPIFVSDLNGDVRTCVVMWRGCEKSLTVKLSTG